MCCGHCFRRMRRASGFVQGVQRRADLQLRRVSNRHVHRLCRRRGLRARHGELGVRQERGSLCDVYRWSDVLQQRVRVVDYLWPCELQWVLSG